VSTSAADTGVNLADVGGSFTVTGGTIVAGTTSVGISVVNSAAGSFDFGNTSVSATGGTGVGLSSNVATVRFGDLDIAPNTGERALLANGNTGTITTTSGTIVTAGHVAVQVTGPTELNMVLTSVSTSGGAAPGIDLSNTSGVFRIVGSGTAGSGGTIANTTASASIALSNVANVSLARMVVRDNAGSGINGTNVAGFALDQSTLQNNGDDASETNIRLIGLSGTASITSSTIGNASGDNVLVQNTGGALTFSLSGSTLSSDATEPDALNGLSINAGGSSVINASIGNNNFRPPTCPSQHERHELGGDARLRRRKHPECANAIATACNASFTSGSNAPFLTPSRATSSPD
jgi:hypothetical protein